MSKFVFRISVLITFISVALINFGASPFEGEYGRTEALWMKDITPVDVSVSDTIVYYDTVFIYDTIYVYESVYDTIFIYDTVYVYDIEKLEPNPASLQTELQADNQNFLPEVPGDAYYSKWQNVSFELFGSGFQHKNTFPVPDDGEDLRSKRIKSISENPGFSLGTNFNFHFSKNRYFQTGLEYSRFTENVNLSYAYTLFDTSYNTLIEEYEQLHIDTIWFLNIDSLMLGDTVYMAYPDTSYLQQADTSIVSRVKRLDKEVHKNRISTWSYLEIPVLGAFQLRKNQWTMDFKGGIITGILIRHDRYMIYPAGELYELRELTSSEISNIVFNLYLSSNVAYQLNTHWTVLCEPYLKYPLAEINSQSPLIKTTQSGLRLGMRYNF